MASLAGARVAIGSAAFVAGTTKVVREAVLLDESGSVCRTGAATDTWLRSSPSASGRTVMLMLTDPCTGNVSTEQVTTRSEAAHRPVLAVAERM